MAVTATFHGNRTTGYLQYLDLGSDGHTLIAVPGNTYDIAIASGWEVLAATPADGNWGGGGLFPAGFSGVPGFASPGAFIPGSPGAARQPAPPMFSVLDAARAERAGQERLAEEIMGVRLLAAGWTQEELVLRRDGWAEGDIRRRRQRMRLLELRAQFR